MNGETSNVPTVKWKVTKAVSYDIVEADFVECHGNWIMFFSIPGGVGRQFVRVYSSQYALYVEPIND